MLDGSNEKTLHIVSLFKNTNFAGALHNVCYETGGLLHLQLVPMHCIKRVLLLKPFHCLKMY